LVVDISLHRGLLSEAVCDRSEFLIYVITDKHSRTHEMLHGKADANYYGRPVDAMYDTPWVAIRPIEMGGMQT